MPYPVDEEILDELVSWLSFGTDKGQTVRTLCDLREGSEDETTKQYFQKAIEQYAGEDYCLECGGELCAIGKKEYHSYLEENPYEWVDDYWICPDCEKRYDY